jgi:Rieske Fe-S protein
MFLFGMLALAFVLIGSVFKPPNGKAEIIADPLRVNVGKIPYGQIYTYRWNNQDVGVLHNTDNMLEQLAAENKEVARYFVFYNTGGDVGCPLSLARQAGSFQLQDICSRIAYRLDGTLLKPHARAKDLSVPPHQWVEEKVLILGESI